MATSNEAKIKRAKIKKCFVSNGRSNPEVVGSIPTKVIRFFLCLVWFPDSLH